MITQQDINIRDPFVFPLPDGTYLLTGTMRPPDGRPGVFAYPTKDLKQYGEPVRLFDPPEDFWGDRDFWAPEIHFWRGRYYLFCSFRSQSHRRATQVLEAESPFGPYHPLGRPHTPELWHCLDGTLYIDPDGDPWMVYVREFVQMVDGEMYAQRLSHDFSVLIGEPKKLFSATWAPWCVTNDEGGMPFDTPGGYITDGPFLFRLSSGRLGMLWSSFCKTGYCQAVCWSHSGTVLGPWAQENVPLYECNSGHGMLFDTHDGQKVLSLHNHNSGFGISNPVYLKVGERDDRLIIEGELL